jgi:hypothetical protein
VLSPFHAVVEIDTAVDETDVEERKLRHGRVALRPRHELVEQILEVVAAVAIAHQTQLRLYQGDRVHHRREVKDRSPCSVNVKFVDASEGGISGAFARREAAHRDRGGERIDANSVDRNLAVKELRARLLQLRLHNRGHGEKPDRRKDNERIASVQEIRRARRLFATTPTRAANGKKEAYITAALSAIPNLLL